MFLYILWGDSIHLHPISQGGPCNFPHLFLPWLCSPCHTIVEMGLDSRRESVRMVLCLLSLLLGALYGICCFWRGPGSPLLSLSPPFHLTVSCPSSFHERAITDKVFGAAAMIAVPFIRLSILYCSSQPAMNSSVTPLIPLGSSLSSSSPSWASSSSNCARHTVGFLEMADYPSFPQGKEASGPRFRWTVCCLGPGGSRQLN